MRDPYFGAKDFLKERRRIRLARKPSVAEIIVLGFHNNSVPVSSVRIVKHEARREVDQ